MNTGALQPVLTAEDLSIGYQPAKKNPFVVAENINLSLYRGELVCLIGPNGSGKSTLMRTLTGLLSPLHGEVALGGSPIGDLTPRELARKISIVTTERVNLGMFTGYSLVALGRYPYTGWRGKLSREDTEAVIRAIRNAGAENVAHRNVNELSDGERQKIMIARALCQESDIMILDEPTAFLDLPRRVEVMGLLYGLSREMGTSVLISTHELDLALRTADRVFLISPGGKIFAGAPEDCILSGAFEETFASETVHFDKRHGNFHIFRKQKEEVCLAGGGIFGYWTRKALEREGFVVSGAPERAAVLTVECDEERTRWILREKSGSREFTSLYDLILHLRDTYHSA